MKIQRAIKRFSYKRLNNYIYGKAHDAIIGEWIRWWITDLTKNRKTVVHSVINPAMRARFWGKPYYADLLFAEHSERADRGPDTNGVERDFFRVVGVGEIENDNSLGKLKHKVDSLYAYEKCRDRRRRIKFPDLEFAILCTFYSDKDFRERKNEVDRIKSLMKRKSKDSKMEWVLYLLQKNEIDNDYFFRVTGYARDRSRKSFYYSEGFIGRPTFHIFSKGRQQRITKS